MQDQLTLDFLGAKVEELDKIETRVARAAGNACTYIALRTAQSIVRLKDGVFVRKARDEAEARRWCAERGVAFTPLADLTAGQKDDILFA